MESEPKTDDEEKEAAPNSLVDLYSSMLTACRVTVMDFPSSFREIEKHIRARSADEQLKESLDLAVQTAAVVHARTSLMLDASLDEHHRSIGLSTAGWISELPKSVTKLIEHVSHQHDHLIRLAEARAKISRLHILTARGQQTLKLLPTDPQEQVEQGSATA